ncbi:MAG: hypothetical protein WDZ46_08470 [Solirubrobacterales bacterium]
MSRGASRSRDRWWGHLSAHLLHPLQVEIVEALEWIDRPVSCSDLGHIFGAEQQLTHIAYHVRRLARLQVLQCVNEDRVRGVVKSSYRLSTEGELKGA